MYGDSIFLLNSRSQSFVNNISKIKLFSIVWVIFGTTITLMLFSAVSATPTYALLNLFLLFWYKLKYCGALQTNISCHYTLPLRLSFSQSFPWHSDLSSFSCHDRTKFQVSSFLLVNSSSSKARFAAVVKRRQPSKSIKTNLPGLAVCTDWAL